MLPQKVPASQTQMQVLPENKQQNGCSILSYNVRLENVNKNPLTKNILHWLCTITCSCSLFLTSNYAGLYMHHWIQRYSKSLLWANCNHLHSRKTHYKKNQGLLAEQSMSYKGFILSWALQILWPFMTFSMTFSSFSRP